MSDRQAVIDTEAADEQYIELRNKQWPADTLTIVTSEYIPDGFEVGDDTVILLADHVADDSAWSVEGDELVPEIYDEYADYVGWFVRRDKISDDLIDEFGLHRPARERDHRESLVPTNHDFS